MKVYVLDIKGKIRDRIVTWLQEDKRVKEVQIFEDYKGFAEYVGKSPPDRCVIRLGRDEIPGLSAADTLRQTAPNVHVVFVSESRDYALDAYETGADGYLLCPVDKEKFDRCFK
jgi:two-component system LytT family response regulator